MLKLIIYERKLNMSRLYFDAIYGPQEGTKRLCNTMKNFNLFIEYIEFAIQAQKKKKICARHKEVPQGKIVDFKTDIIKVAVEQSQTIQFIWDDNWYEIIGDCPHNTSRKIGFEEAEEYVSLNEENYRDTNDGRAYIKLEFDLKPNEIITWNGNRISLRKVKIDKDNIKITQSYSSANIQVIECDQVYNQYTIKFEGQIREQEPLIVNEIEVRHWRYMDKKNGKIVYENGDDVHILHKDENKLFIEKDNEHEIKLYMNEDPLVIKVEDLPMIQQVVRQDTNIKYEVSKEAGKLVVYDEDLKVGSTIRVQDTRYPFIWYDMHIERKVNEENSVWIELIDDNEDEDGSYTSRSKLDYFFEEGVDKLEDKQKGENRRVFKITGQRKEEYRLKLENEKNHIPLKYNDLPKELYIPVNLTNLNRQKQALETLENRPLYEQKNLLELTVSKNESRWQEVIPEDIDEWYVLKDETKKGTDAQRRFVSKALATPDFVLLEGPPGSGKTTAIMELIVQLIHQGKRVLLSASTHVAIDNVLERLEEKGLMEGIFPIRIGDQKNVADSIKKYQIDNVVGKESEYQDIVIDAANLVCGTTIGLLRNPKFGRGIEHGEPIIPQFDYLIIDESSKTTFQEFLVPAIYAKHWILVGDVKQLSPFVDRSYLEANLENIQGMKLDLQKACLYIFHYIERKYKEGAPKYCIIESSSVVEMIKKELNLRGITRIVSKVAFLEESKEKDNIDTEVYWTVTREECEQGMSNAWVLPAMDVLIIKDEDKEKLKKYIPDNMLVLNRSNWEIEEQNYKMNAYYNKPNRTLNYQFGRGKKLETPEEIIDYNNKDILGNKTWAEELAWRMVRIYELRGTSKNIERYQDEIEKLIPGGRKLYPINEG